MTSDSGARTSAITRVDAAQMLAGIRCLIIEDHAIISHHFERLLGRAGATTESASTVEEACLALAVRAFDVLLLDLNLFGENGVAVARAARSLASPPCVLVVTGDPRFGDLEELEALGAVVMMKINVGESLIAIVRAVLDVHRARTVFPRSGATAPATGGVETAPGSRTFSAREREFLARLEAGEVLSSEAVAREILGRGSANAGNSNTAQKFVSRLRAKLQKLGEHDHFIESVYGGGYRLSRMTASRNRTC